MSLWSFWTSVSVIILTAGSAAVFGWFLRDILMIRRELIAEERVRNGLDPTPPTKGGRP